MTDRELLKLAAKAAGIDLKWMTLIPTGEELVSIRWNPLTDDGDALRLAVKLGLTVYQWSDEVCVCNEKGTVNENVARVGDIYGATRRAIVLAAAEIGKGIKQPITEGTVETDNYYKSQTEAEELGKGMK